MQPMMDSQLTITSVMKFAERMWGEQEIVSHTADNPRHRYCYRDSFVRVRQLANALRKLGAQPDDVLATLAWNDYRHFELYYAISCSGMICHTINPRLFDEQIEYIVNHAQDSWLFLDVEFVALMERLQDKLPALKGFIILTNQENMPATTLRNALCYEALIAEESDQFDWPDLPEDTPSALCYTSGTTGNPKGVLYTHRSTLLHCYGTSMPNAFALSASDTIMPIVPMFHANGWALVYSAPMTGAKLVLPGSKSGDGEVICNLINEESVTFSAGVPTVWLSLLDYLDRNGGHLDSLDRLIIGGAACPYVIYDQMRSKYNVKVQQGWGMTELNPIATFNGELKPSMQHLPRETLDQIALKQGRVLFGVDIKIVDAEDNDLPWNGEAAGAIKVRGPWVINQYFNQENPAVDAKGWFETGDVGTIDSNGYMQITDRIKDVIKSGGEWIGSIELENTAVDHPQVAEAAVIGVHHPKWTERPLLLVVCREGEEISREEMLSWFDGKVAKWWIPQDVVFVQELPHTATGKVSKKDLREQFRDFSWTQ